MLSRKFRAYSPLAASDEITWKKPRTVIVALAWSITSASIMLNVFLSGGKSLDWPVLLLLFFVSAFAGVLLEDIKSIILSAFETLFLTMLLTYTGMIFPVLIGNVEGVYQTNLVYTVAIEIIFKMFFPLAILTIVVGGAVGGFAKDLLS
jgi:hypothetical protein